MPLPFKNGLVVSCQALEDEPLYGAQIMAKMAVAAQQGGAVAIRANSPADIEAIKKAVDLPIIGIHKVHYDHSPVYITPTITEVNAVIRAGAEVVSVDATDRPRPGETLEEIVEAIHRANRIAMADVSTVEEGIGAAQRGFDIVATTLVGYTTYTANRPLPDMETVQQLCQVIDIPVIAEGHISTPEQMKHCFESGAFAVVVGTAITRPQRITEQFVRTYQEWSTNNSKTIGRN